eukprot:6175458-Pleurochrysis_carterae.AAC.2
MALCQARAIISSWRAKSWTALIIPNMFSRIREELKWRFSEESATRTTRSLTYLQGVNMSDCAAVGIYGNGALLETRPFKSSHPLPRNALVVHRQFCAHLRMHGGDVLSKGCKRELRLHGLAHARAEKRDEGVIACLYMRQGGQFWQLQVKVVVNVVYVRQRARAELLLQQLQKLLPEHAHSRLLLLAQRHIVRAHT